MTHLENEFKFSNLDSSLNQAITAAIAISTKNQILQVHQVKNFQILRSLKI